VKFIAEPDSNTESYQPTTEGVVMLELESASDFVARTSHIVKGFSVILLIQFELVCII
jgi:translation elongation factor EF-Ts